MKALVKKLYPLLLTSIIAGIVLSILGPFGTSHLPFLKSAIYWIGLCVAGGLGAGLVDYMSTHFKWRLNLWQFTFGQSIGATIFVCATMLLAFPQYTLKGLLLTAFYVWVIGIVICFIGALLKASKTQTTPIYAEPQRSALLERLPYNLREAEIYALSAEDHYVRIHTDKGDEMVLMRLSDAIKETHPLNGVQTHRSWWVAKAGVESIVRNNGKIILTLKNANTAPVSRNGSKAVKEAGWI